MGPVLSTRSVLTLALVGMASISSAGLLADFDGFTEGEFFDFFTTGGIRFHDVIAHEGGYTNFTIENASSGFLNPSPSLPNVLGFGAYVPGPEPAFGGIGSFWFTSDTAATTAGLDVWAFQGGEPGENTLTLRGYSGAQILHTVAFSFVNSMPAPVHRRLDLPTGAYDSFELFSSGAGFQGDTCIVVDNVTIEAVPEPTLTGLTLLGLGFARHLRRRKSTTIGPE